jgi:hypothetical protein
MQTVRASIGDAEVLIEAIDSDVEILGAPAGTRATQATGMADDLRRSYAQAKSVIREIADDIGNELHQLAASSRPSGLQIEFDLGFSAQVGAWVITGKGDCSLKVAMTWNFADDD